MLWGLSIATWESVARWSLWVAAAGGVVAAVAGFISGFVGIKLSDLSQQEFTIRHEASERALEKERKERIELEQKYAWRRLTTKQVASLVAGLQNKVLALHFDYSPNDPEANQYAQDLARALTVAGVRDLYVHPLVLPPPPEGILLSGPDSEELSALQLGLRDAGIEFRAGRDATALRISVGAKPRPF